MSTQIDTAAMGGVSEELIDKCPEPVGEVIEEVIAELRTPHDRIEQLEETVEQQQGAIKEKDERIEQLEETVNQQADRLEMQSSLIHDLKDKLDTEQRVSAEMGQRMEDGLKKQASNVTGAHNRISNLKDKVEEGGSDGSNPEVEGPETALQDYETPMEFITATPEHMVDRLGLSENQERARAIAIDILDYSEKAPAGRVIDSSTVKKVLTARMGSAPHNQTVSRVMRYFAILGEGQVRYKERDTKNNLLVIDPEAAEKYHAGCDPGMSETLLTSVTIAG